MKRPSKRVLANRRNARQSTGPRTPGGKARSAQNARKHGLAAPLPAEIQAVAQEIAPSIVGAQASSQQYDAAVAFTQSRLNVERVRFVEASIMRRHADAGDDRLRNGETGEAVTAYLRSGREATSEWLHSLLVALARLRRYEQRALSQARKAARLLEGSI